MKLLKLIPVFLLALVPLVSAYDFNFRGNSVDSFNYDGNDYSILRTNMNFKFNDQSSFRPNNIASGYLKMSSRDDDMRSFDVSFKNLLDNYYEEDPGILIMQFENCPIKMTHKVEIPYKNRVKTKIVTEHMYGSVTMRIDLNTNTINIVGNADNGNIIYEADGITGPLRACCTTSGYHQFCGDPNSDGYKIACGLIPWPPLSGGDSGSPGGI
jgi:hypothetical protein